MKSVGILYIGDRKLSSEKFLSKDELRKLFPEHSEIAMVITNRKMRFNKKRSESSAKKGKKKKKQKKKKGFEQKDDRFIRRGRVINL